MIFFWNVDGKGIKPAQTSGMRSFSDENIVPKYYTVIFIWIL